MRIRFWHIFSLLLAGHIILSVSDMGVVQAQGSLPIPAIKPFVTGDKAPTKPLIKNATTPKPATKPDIETNANIQVEVTPAAETSVPLVRVARNNIFTNKQAQLYEEIFDLQDQGDITGANAKIGKLKSDLILGHILAQRYLHPTAYKASINDLADWLNQYSDHPQAAQIYKLAQSRNAKNIEINKPKKLKKIAGNIAVTSQKAKLYRSQKRRTNDQQERVQKLYRDIYNNVKRERPTLALNILSNDYAVQFMDDVEYDRQRAIIAAGYLYAGKNKEALRLAQSALNRSSTAVPLAGWVKGLTQWQAGQYNSAAEGFQLAASSQYSSGWLVSASAYWASRAHMRQGNMALVSQWLALSATYPRTFYGLIAIRALGHDNHFNWDLPNLGREQRKIVENTKQGQRAIALIQANQKDLAALELKTLVFERDIEKKRSLLAFAHYYKLPSLLMSLGNAVTGPRGNYYDAALYPELDWLKDEGFKVDKSLVHAFIRQESRFQSHVQSGSGATGLMQIMPTTANYISGEDIYDKAIGQYKLKQPAVNLALGQKYIQELLTHRAVNNDLMALAIAYNAGPGNLSKWKKTRGHINDPLLFIETIPFNETRAFVERIMSNYWIYKMRFGEPTPSLDAVAEGKWAAHMASRF